MELQGIDENRVFLFDRVILENHVNTGQLNDYKLYGVTNYAMMLFCLAVYKYKIT